MTPVPPQLSVVVPVYDECEAIGPLIDEILAALRGRLAFELIVVDDGSGDGTLEVLRGRLDDTPELRVLRHCRRCGQSTALRTGIQAARAAWVATLDGDGQNDPADIPRLLDARVRAQPRVRLLIGWRVERRDPLGKRLASRIANALRRRILRDDTPDTGCGLKLIDREVFLGLPYFDHMHRFLPALVQRAGWATLSVPVGHRPRRGGRSKYGNLARAWVGLADLGGVAWLIRRSRLPEVEEVRP